MDVISQRKAKLKTSAENHKKAISKDLNIFAAKTEGVVGTTAIGIGILFSTMALYKMLRGRKNKKRSKTPNRLIQVVKQQLALYVLSEGRSKIVDYINSLDEKKS